MFGPRWKSLAWSSWPNAGLCLALIHAHATAQPSLNVSFDDTMGIRLSWIDDAGAATLESTATLGPAAVWQPVAANPVAVDNFRSVVLPAREGTRFYRLRGGPRVTTILEVSPAPGEVGVAVTREFVARFSGPLAEDVTVPADQCIAEFGGRRLLSRIELSADRRAITLFPLETLPGRARIRVTLKGAGLRDAGGLDLDADGDGQPGGVLSLDYVTGGLEGLPDTGVIGRVLASERGTDGADLPLANVTITVDGAEETLRATTDSEGRFHLQPAPAGRFFVHVDGRTATGSDWPSGAYYPFVGKAWEAAAGVSNNLAGGSGEIFLPLVPGDALQPVSAVAETRITFSPAVIAANPDLAGVEVRVPPNALFSDDGSRGGRVGLAPVPPDRLPEPLPPGLESLPLVITIQTDGPLNFDQPVPVRFPNLPDPTTGERLPPGAKTVLWSFNHDTGHWEAQGTATITADGLHAETDPGVGVRQPGWHGIQSGTIPRGPRDTDRDRDRDDDDYDPPRDHTDDCYKPVYCALTPTPKSGAACILECSTDAIDDFLCRLNPLCDDDDVVLPERSPIELALCAGNPLNCQFQDRGVQEIFETNRYEDMLVQRDRDCMDDCMDPIVTPFPLVVPCAVADPCPGGLPFPLPGGGPIALFGRLQAPPDPAEVAALIPLDWLREQRALWNVEGEFYSLILGNPRVLETSPTELKHWRAFLRAARAAADPVSEAGVRYSPAEKAALAALPRPSHLSAPEWSALVDRLDLLLGNALPPAEWDAEGIRTAAEWVVAVRQELLNRNWRYRLDGLINGLLLLSEERSLPPGSPEFPAGPHFYRLVNLSNGFEFRGRLSPNGRFENLALPPDTLHAVGYLDPETGRVAGALFLSRGVGEFTEIPSAPFEADAGVDSDGDGLSDLAERILGTSPLHPDSDGDGLSDRDELLSGGNPLDGIAPQLGPIASTGQGGPGMTLDVAVQQDIAVTIGTSSGLAFYDVRQPDAPVLIQRFRAHGDFDSLAVQWPFVLAGAVGSGVSYYRVDDPAQPPVRLWQAATANRPRGVALGFGHAYVVGNALQVFDLRSGLLVHEEPVAGVRVALDGEHLYVLRTGGTGFGLDAHQLVESGRRLIPRGTVSWPALLPILESAPPLVVAEGLAYVGGAFGYFVVDVSDPQAPVVVGGVGIRAAGAQHLAPDGGGLMATTTSSGGPATLRVGIHSVANPSVTTNLLFSFDTPGGSRRVTPYRGRLFIGDSEAGLTVANYRSRDFGTSPPTVELRAFPTLRDPDIHDSGEWLRVEARARDDVLVREVEFHVDGGLRTVVGTYPFATDVLAPLLVPGKSSFTVQARAWDTAGNSTWSPVLTLGLTHGLRPPRLLAFAPTSGTRFLTNTVVPVTATFDEPMDLDSLAGGWTLRGHGPDGLPDTADDVVVPGAVELLGGTAYALTFVQPLPADFYTVTLATNVTDLAGNRLVETTAWEFGIRPLTTFIGTGRTWTASGAAGADWSLGRVPTMHDMVEIDLPGEPMVVPGIGAAAYDLRVRSPFRLAGGTLTLGGLATFEGPVTWAGQDTITGGESHVLDSLHIGGPQNNSFLSDHVLHNFGTVTLEKRSGFTGLLLRNPLQRPVGIVNHPGATWRHLGGSVVSGSSGTPATFENRGRFIKDSSGADFIRIDHFLNLGAVEVHAGALELYGQSSVYPDQHFGSYRVDAGARLAFLDGFHVFGRTTRIFGDGAVELTGHFAGTDFPGTLQSGGHVRIPAGTVNLSGDIRMGGDLSIAPNAGARFSGLAPRVAGTMSVEGRASLTVASGANLMVGALTNAGTVTVAAALEVSGPASVSEGALFRGGGRIRTLGPLAFLGTSRDTLTATAGPGRFEMGGLTTLASHATVELRSFTTVILPDGTLDLGQADTFRLGFDPLVNEGLLLKSLPGATHVLTGIENRGQVRITDGGITFAGGPLLQTAGLFSLQTTGIVVRAQANQGPNGIVNLLGGRLEGGEALYCGRFTNAAVVAPGLPVGRLTLEVGNHPTLSVYHQTESGRLHLDIAGPEPGTEHDVLTISGRAVLGGTLELAVDPAYDPPAGQTFTVLNAGRGLEGSFAGITGHVLPGGKRLDIEYAANAVSLRVVASP